MGRFVRAGFVGVFARPVSRVLNRGVNHVGFFVCAGFVWTFDCSNCWPFRVLTPASRPVCFPARPPFYTVFFASMVLLYVHCFVFAAVSGQKLEPYPYLPIYTPTRGDAHVRLARNRVKCVVSAMFHSSLPVSHVQFSFQETHHVFVRVIEMIESCSRFPRPGCFNTNTNTNDR